MPAPAVPSRRSAPTGWSISSVVSADDARGYVYLPAEAPTGDLCGGRRPGDNVCSSSLVCLDVRAGKVVWYFQ